MVSKYFPPKQKKLVTSQWRKAGQHDPDQVIKVTSSVIRH